MIHLQGLTIENGKLRYEATYCIYSIVYTIQYTLIRKRPSMGFSSFVDRIRIRIQQKGKEHINKTVNSGLFVLLESSIE